jgi:hypothetical protein
MECGQIHTQRREHRWIKEKEEKDEETKEKFKKEPHRFPLMTKERKKSNKFTENEVWKWRGFENE